MTKYKSDTVNKTPSSVTGSIRDDTLILSYLDLALSSSSVGPKKGQDAKIDSRPDTFLLLK